jgi:hypothetical protein
MATLLAAIAQDTTTVAASTSDGASWSGSTLPGGGAWSAIAWNGSIYCAVRSSTDQVATSPDGVTWTLRTLPSTEFWSGIAWNGSIFCVVASYTSAAATSPDGITWTARTLASAQVWLGVVWSGNVFCAVSEGGSNAPGVAATSPDGITWTDRALPITTSNLWDSIAWNGSVFCTIARYTSVAATSPDGVNWTVHEMPVVGDWRALAWNGSVFFAIDARSNVGATSPDGSSWTPRTMPSAPFNWVAITASRADGFFAVSNGVEAGYSPDGITWTPRTMPSAAWGTVAYAEVVGGEGAAAARPTPPAPPTIPPPAADCSPQKYLDMLDRLLPLEYLAGLKNPGPGYELFQAAANVAARLCQAVQVLDKQAFLLSATSGAFSTALVKFARPSAAAGPVVVKAGTLVTTSIGNRQFVLLADTYFGPLDVVTTSAVVQAIAVGYEWNDHGLRFEQDERRLTISENEVLTPAPDGVTTVFHLAHAPIDRANWSTDGGLRLYRNGVRQTIDVDFSLSGAAVTITPAPTTDEDLLADYPY